MELKPLSIQSGPAKWIFQSNVKFDTNVIDKTDSFHFHWNLSRPDVFGVTFPALILWLQQHWNRWHLRYSYKMSKKQNKYLKRSFSVGGGVFIQQETCISTTDSVTVSVLTTYTIAWILMEAHGWFFTSLSIKTWVIKRWESKVFFM